MQRVASRGEKFCSKECWSKRKPPIQGHCLFCSKSFIAYVGRKVYCNQTCRDKHYRIRFTNTESHQWKGDSAGYSAIHKWISKYLGRPQACTHCKTDKGVLHWANIDHLYSRKKTDWVALCAKCHARFDRGFPKYRQAIVKRWKERVKHKKLS